MVRLGKCSGAVSDTLVRDTSKLDVGMEHVDCLFSKGVEGSIDYVPDF